MPELTPVKVRGKKGKEWAALMRRRKRLMSEDQPRDVYSSKRRKIDEKIQPHLEALPTELLQSIFVFSREVNLPLASLRLSAKLSDRHLYMHFCFQAFCKGDYFLLDPDATYTTQDLADIPVMRKIAESSISDINFKLSEYLASTHEPAFQSDVLKRKWLTWSFYREYLQKAFEKSKQDYENQQTSKSVDQGDGPMHERASKRQSIHRRMTIEPQPLDFEADDLIVRKEPEYRWMRLLPNCYIPEKLFHIPFAHDQLMFLKTVIRAGAIVDWYGSAAGERAEVALEHSIGEGIPDATRLLLHDAIGIPWQGRYLEQAYREKARRPKRNFEPIISYLKESRERSEQDNV
ncbi:hypothetical protein EV356DRAFT_529666 [Viridothelium virens]|uniref:F-box domain-containing protein n=1 Tax=Viridothelium virens TaxID=1048519 RepID=A0A6A6HHV6_VIRVR|nr:hypothetical protein EV356DRAFT_529666 [Viridothelium virens]